MNKLIPKERIYNKLMTLTRKENIRMNQEMYLELRVHTI
jgi:hypothetical protein